MIMEYAKVVNGGTSDVVVTSREVTPNVELSGLRAVCEAPLERNVMPLVEKDQ